MNKQKSKVSKKTKSKNLTYSLIVGVVILVLSILPYLHDFDALKGKKGFSGFSSLRVGVWAVSLFLFAICGWILAFINSKGKHYRFAILAPIAMAVFQLFIYVLDSRQSQINSFNFKVVFNFIFILILILIFFKLKRND